MSLTHKSFFLDNPDLYPDYLLNELMSFKRMELEGDSIVFARVTQDLLDRYPEMVTGTCSVSFLARFRNPPLDADLCLTDDSRHPRLQHHPLLFCAPLLPPRRTHSRH